MKNNSKRKLVYRNLGFTFLLLTIALFINAWLIVIKTGVYVDEHLSTDPGTIWTSAVIVSIVSFIASAFTTGICFYLATPKDSNIK